MTTRTKIGVCVGVIVLAVGVVLVRSFPSKPAVTVSFVRYAGNGSMAILTITNRADSVVLCAVSGNVRQEVGERGTIVYSMDLGRLLRLKGHTDCQTEVSGIRPSSRLCLLCQPQPSPLRQRMEAVLLTAGLNIASTGFVASVDLPAR